MGKEQWQAVFVIGAILLVGFFFQPAREEASGKAVQLLEDEDAAQQPADEEAIQQPGEAVLRAPPSPLPPIPVVQPVCDALYETITQQFLQKMGVTTSRFFDDSFIELINNRYLVVTAFISSTPELYLYDIGPDGRFDTPDDAGFLIEPLQSSILSLDSLTSGGVTTLFWYVGMMGGGSGSLKKCTLTPQGCIPTTITALSGNNVKGLVASASTNRLFLLHTPVVGGGSVHTVASCSLQSGTPDFCGNGLSSFTTHQQLSLPYRIYGYDIFSLSEVGFYLADSGVAPLQNFIININQPTVISPIQNKLNPTPYNPLTLPFMFAVDSTFPASPQLVMVDSTTGTIITPPLESIPSSFLWRSLAIQSFGSQIITLYFERRPLSPAVLMGKRVGSPPVELGTFTFTGGDFIWFAITLPDFTVLGILSSGNLVKLSCTP